jgi:hypothetical protein
VQVNHNTALIQFLVQFSSRIIPSVDLSQED